MAQDHRPGLPSLNQARAERRRQLTTGKARIGGFPPQAFLWMVLIFGIGGTLYFRSSQQELEQTRATIMAKQRAVAKSLGPKLLPIRDNIEKWAQELAGKYPGDFVADGVTEEWLAETPGIYLRLSLEDARDPERLRAAAADSLRDGFTACLFRSTKAGDRTAGAPCSESADCEAGHLCTEFGVCQLPSQPFNARLLYRALHVLSSKWTDEVHEASNDLALVAYERGLDSVTETDIPIAIEVYQRAKTLTLVLDEEPEGALAPELEPTEQGPRESALERLQRSEHHARVGVWDIESGKLLVRHRAQTAGELRDIGERTVTSPAALATRQRQANSCGLALSVRGAVQRAQLKSAAPEPGAAAESAP